MKCLSLLWVHCLGVLVVTIVYFPTHTFLLSRWSFLLQTLPISLLQHFCTVVFCTCQITCTKSSTPTIFTGVWICFPDAACISPFLWKTVSYLQNFACLRPRTTPHQPCLFIITHETWLTNCCETYHPCCTRSQHSQISRLFLLTGTQEIYFSLLETHVSLFNSDFLSQPSAW